MDRINRFLDQYILPWPVKFLTHRFVIIGTIIFIVPLIIWSDQTGFVLVANSYLNIIGVAVSSIVLLYTRLGEQQAREASTKKAQAEQAIQPLIIVNLHVHYGGVPDIQAIVGQLQAGSSTPTQITAGDDFIVLPADWFATLQSQGITQENLVASSGGNPGS